MLLMSPVILAIAIINIKVDPANIYQKDYESKAASLLLSGQNIAGMSNYDERCLQERIIADNLECPDTIILGSSRVMTLSEDVVTGMKNYWNHGVSGAGIMDYMGILGIYNEYSEIPKKIIIGVDPWILNENSGDTRYQSIIQYADKLKSVIEAGESEIHDINKNEKTVFDKKIQAISEIISLTYFQSSLNCLIQNPKMIKDRTFDFYGTQEKNVEENIRYTDGSIEYNKAFRDRSIQDAENDAKKYVSGKIYQIENYQELSKENCLLLERLIEYLQVTGSEIVLYLPPYHPFVYNYIKEHKDYRMVLESEIYFRNLAKEKGISIYGSYDPEQIQCTESDFLDGMHMRRKNTGRSWVNLELDIKN